MSTAPTAGLSVGDYLIKRLVEEGVGHVFGIPGDYVLTFFSKLCDSSLQVINTCDEQGAGFAADAYPRLEGLDVVCVTYGVGGLKLVNSTAQAYAEKSPVLVISGAPGEAERHINDMLHHKAHHYDDQLKIFERITSASAYLKNAENAFSEIDHVLASIRESKRPGYIELPRDMVLAVPEDPKPSGRKGPGGQPSRVPVEVLDEAASMINAAQRPVIIEGVEVSRYGLADQMLALAWRANIPICGTILGKSAIPEDESLYMGIYAGALSNDLVRAYVEESDCLILIGVLFSDLNMGAYTAHLDPEKMIYMTSDGLALGNHRYPFSGMDLLEQLYDADLRWHEPGYVPHPQKPKPFGEESPSDEKISATRLFQIVGAFLDDGNILIADVGDALFGGIEICRHNTFVSPAYYASLGFAVPASIGVQSARPDLRPVILTGDGSFQMTGMELAAAARYGLNPIVIVLNNQGYGTERPMLDGPFNDVAFWRYSRVPEVIDSGRGFLVRTERELYDALNEARGHDELCILEVLLEKNDISVPLQRLCSGLAKDV